MNSSSDSRLFCYHCGESRNDPRSLAKHIRGHFAPSRTSWVQCPYCDFRTSVSTSLQFHVRRLHPDAEDAETGNESECAAAMLTVVTGGRVVPDCVNALRRNRRDVSSNGDAQRSRKASASDSPTSSETQKESTYATTENEPSRFPIEQEEVRVSGKNSAEKCARVSSDLKTESSIVLEEGVSNVAEAQTSSKREEASSAVLVNEENDLSSIMEEEGIMIDETRKQSSTKTAAAKIDSSAQGMPMETHCVNVKKDSSCFIAAEHPPVVEFGDASLSRTKEEKDKAGTSVDAKTSVKCTVCDYSAESMTFLEIHVYTAHVMGSDEVSKDSEKEANYDENSSPCKRPRRTPKKPSKKNVGEEVSTLSLHPSVQCSLCGFQAESIEFLETHVNSLHGPKDPELPEGESKADKHKAMPPALHCSLCKFAADNDDLLKRHKNTVHAAKKPLGCPHCGYSAVDFDELKIHVAQEHTSDEPQLCSQCEYISTDKQDLEVHMQVVHPKKKYQCTICDYSSKYPSHVSSHIRAQHTKEKPFKCPHCDFRTVQASHLKPHINSKHSTDKPHKCNYCSYSSAQAGNLKSHILKKHTYDMPHKCPYCAYGSAYPGHLKNHIMVRHTNERPHKCSFCTYSAAQLSQLKTHVLAKHTNLKPYTCKMCDYNTATPSNLKYHLRAKHPGLVQSE